MESFEAIQKMVESIGASGTVIIMLAFVLASIVLKTVTYFLKKNDSNSITQKIKGLFALDMLETKNVLKETEKGLDLINVDLTIISRTLNNIVDGLLSINNKMRNVISGKDSKEVIRFILYKSFFFEIVQDIMSYSSSFIANPETVSDLMNQFQIELKNKWTEYTLVMDTFKFPIKIGKAIHERFRETDIDCINNEEGFFKQIINITFNSSLSQKDRFDRSTNYFNLFMQKIMGFVEEEFRLIEERRR
jgi:hypothetical protein